MTTSITARPTTGAGPHPQNQEPHMNYRSIERLIHAIDGGHIRLDHTHNYIDQRNARDVSDVVYATEDRGFITLHPGGHITVTDAGRQWMGRTRLRARKSLTPVFEPPAVA